MVDLAKLLLRIAVGQMVFHGMYMLVHGISPISSLLHARGFPGFFSYGVLIGEFVAPVLVLLGVLTRPAAWVIAFNMLVAVWLAHSADLLHLAKGGGYALELQMFYLFGSVCVALLGAGRYSLSSGVGRWN